MINTNELNAVAESLPTDLKIQLIDRLLNSLNPSWKEFDKAWAREAETRVEELRKGDVKAIPGEDVFARIDCHDDDRNYIMQPDKIQPIEKIKIS